MNLIETTATSLRVVHALQENARIARANLTAIDQCVESVIRLVSFGPGGPGEARRRVTALGLDRLEDYLSLRKSESVQRAAVAAAPPERETKQ
jgi:hypothetical protein